MQVNVQCMIRVIVLQLEVQNSQPNMNNTKSTSPTNTNNNHGSPSPFLNPTQSFIQGIIPDLPLLMYGSGDVHPTLTNPATVELVATLTAQYVEKYVRASVDAHDMLTDGAGGFLPKEPFRKRQRKEDDWGIPLDDLPMPKIRNEIGNSNFNVNSNSNATLKQEGSNEIDNITHDPSASNVNAMVDSSDQLQQQQRDDRDASHSSAQGEYVKGLDIYPNRIRAPHSNIPSTIGFQSFVFPICHDAEIYSRVKENKKFKRELDEVLVDSTVMDFIREEEEGREHLADSAFHWVSVEEKEAANGNGNGNGNGGDANGNGNGNGIGATRNVAEEMKVKRDRDMKRRKEMAGNLAARTNLDVEIPGMEELLPPSHHI